jgi:hypothetical protein
MPELRPMSTPIGEAWNYRQLATRYDALLRRLGVDPPNLVNILIAHSIVAVGWRQNIWWYNAWGAQVGKWSGDWYTKRTKEEADGVEYEVPNQRWRAFHSWREAMTDTLGRIGPNSWNGAYTAAWRIAYDGGSAADYWEQLGVGGYYTSTQFTPAKFQSVHDRVVSELAAATPDEKAAAESWVDSEVDAGRMGIAAGTRRVPPAGVVSQIFGGLALGAIIVGTIFVGRALAKKPTYAGASRW